MSKKNVTENYKGPYNADNEPMNETMVKLILRSAGFSSPEEVRKIAEEENSKARREKPKNKPNEIINSDKWVGNWKKKVSPKPKPIARFK